jgi:pimeloyl-ACP methyl ester carboxylesterase
MATFTINGHDLYYEVHGCGHMPHVTLGEAFNRRVSEFFARSLTTTEKPR